MTAHSRQQQVAETLKSGLIEVAYLDLCRALKYERERKLAEIAAAETKRLLQGYAETEQVSELDCYDLRYRMCTALDSSSPDAKPEDVKTVAEPSETFQRIYDKLADERGYGVAQRVLAMIKQRHLPLPKLPATPANLTKLDTAA